MRRVTLEMSLKPFWDLRLDAVRAVCEEVFRQWGALHRHAEEIAVLLWAADGSEILDYAGEMSDRFEWAKHIGIANSKGKMPHDPEGIALHSRPYLYRKDAPEFFTYGDLARVAATLREVGHAMTGKRIEIGATFDPGGEFARSSFKYERHPEICMANTMGAKSFVTCYATLNADDRKYAGFPDGIPQGTSLGRFLGRQASHFMRDLGFDYLWLSNGFGFGLETWKPTGPLFDGTRFDASAAPELREKVLRFWRDLREELQLPIEVRGTNLGTGADLATDAVPLREILEGGFGIRQTAPNSPWAAINGDFGVEMVGYMGRIVEPPEGTPLPFRYYVHDPWWLNSPWLDRYGREAHDIYLPLAVARITPEGGIQTAETVALLTIDDSYGRMPTQCPDEVTPHLLQALATAPDAPGLLTWVYPYDAFHDYASAAPERLPEAFFHDWYIRSAINGGLPVNTVVSDRSLAATIDSTPAIYRHTVLLSRVPDAGSATERALLAHLVGGGRVLLFGPTDHAGEEMRRVLQLDDVGPLDGEVQLQRLAPVDRTEALTPTRMNHRALLCGGGIRTTLRDAADARVLATATAGGQERIVALTRRDPAWRGGQVAWVRGTLTSESADSSAGLTPDDPAEFARGEALLRDALAALGIRLGIRKRDPRRRDPVVTVSRNHGAVWFAGYTPDTTVALELSLPEGAPLLVGYDAELADGCARYRLPPAWQRECRVIVEQAGECVLSCREAISGQIGITRRLRVEGLEGATLRFLPRDDATGPVTFQLDPKWPWVNGPFLQATPETCSLGPCLTVRDVTGPVLISW